MRTVNIHEAKTHLSHLIELALSGEPFVIAKAGKPVVVVRAISSNEPSPRIGFLKGEITVPADFDTMAAAEIAQMFEDQD